MFWFKKLRRALFTMNSFDDPTIRQVVADMYNVRSHCAKMWYDRRNNIKVGREPINTLDLFKVYPKWLNKG